MSSKILLKFNQKGKYNNIEGVFDNGILSIKCTNELSKNTLITIVGDLVYFSKYHTFINSNRKRKNEKQISLLYFKTVNQIMIDL